MGLFDFFKQKKPVQPSSEIQQDVPVTEKPTYKEPIPLNANQEVSAPVPYI